MQIATATSNPRVLSQLLVLPNSFFKTLQLITHAMCIPVTTIRNVVAARSCFHRRLWFCSQGGVADTSPRWLLQRTFLLECILVTSRNEVVAKVMFLQVCVCPQGGRVSASVHAGMPDPPGPGRPPRSGRHHPPWTRQTPPDQADTTPLDQADPPQTRQTPPGSRLQHTVYERPVRILLECILVL